MENRYQQQRSGGFFCLSESISSPGYTYRYHCCFSVSFTCEFQQWRPFEPLHRSIYTYTHTRTTDCKPSPQILSPHYSRETLHNCIYSFSRCWEQVILLPSDTHCCECPYACAVSTIIPASRGTIHPLPRVTRGAVMMCVSAVT